MYSVQCLGIGRGATNFASGEASSAYVVKKNNKPLLLLDMGAGVGRSAVGFLGKEIPHSIYISHNHSDHTGDLPVFLATQRGARVRLLGHRSVLSIVRKHRLHELPSVNVDPDEDIDWIVGDTETPIEYGDLKFYLFKSEHAYECYGFVLYVNGNPILGWTADSRFNKDVYDAVSSAPIAIVHGRDRPSGDHAALDEIDEFAKSAPETQFFVSHYGSTDFQFTSRNVILLTVGQEVSL